MRSSIVAKDECSPGLILPAFDERGWSRFQRATLYLLGLVYVFLGITVIMEVFMTAVEAISGQKKKVYKLRPDLPEHLKQRVWNDTVANLTLMAAGVSAPEILLSIVETIGGGFQAGKIGPGAIVGSGAINILVVAFCIVAVPKHETRQIAQFRVFLVTGFFHLASYLWLYLILDVISPEVVEVWEGLITFIFFPFFVFVAYAIGEHCWTKNFPVLRNLRGDETDKEFAEACFRGTSFFNEENVTHFIREVMKYPGMTLQDAAVLAAAKMVETDRTSMWYRIGGARILTSGKPLRHKIKRRLMQVYTVLEQQLADESMTGLHDDEAVVEFESALIAVTEAAVDFPVFINRYGSLNNSISVRVTSVDGMAVHGEDFVPVNEVITFEPYETRAQMMVKIIDENKYEPTEEFFLRLNTIQQDTIVKLGKVHIMEIKIINVISPGVVEFKMRGMIVKETDLGVEVQLIRKDGIDGEVSVDWTTQDLTAKAGVDYQHSSGRAVFNHGVVKKSFQINLINTMSDDKDVSFEVVLSNATGGVMLGALRKMKIIITDDDEDFFDMDNFFFMTNINTEALDLVKTTWCQQIKEAMLPNGGNLDSAKNLDYFLHFLFFFWKVLFSFIPPPTLLKGWLSFFTAMGLVGLLATLAGDLASIFGCSVGLHDTITAMTLVAIGTSLTDAFACRFALLHGKYADSAIGNINGSAAINVYLGFGLPWAMAAIYHKVKGDQLVVPRSGGLGSIIIGYMVVVLLALCLLLTRRRLSYFGRAEIGGPSTGRFVSAVFLTILWMVYITICYLQIQGYVDLF